MTPRLSLLSRMPNQKKHLKHLYITIYQMTPRLSLLWRMPNKKKTSKTPLYHYLSHDPTPIPVVENA